MKMQYVSLALIALVITGCAGPAERAPRDGTDTLSATDPPVNAMRTARTDYSLHETMHGYESTIAYAFTNDFIDTVYVVNCNGDVSPALQRRTPSGEWEDWWIPPTLACLSPPLRIARGSSYSDSLRVVITPHDSAYFQHLRSSAMPDTFRLIWHQALVSYEDTHSSFGDQLPIEQRVSNPFVMRLEQ